MASRFRKPHLVSAAVLLTFALLSFFPALSFSYFFNDDYLLAESIGAKCDHREFVYWGWNRQLGRPLSNYLHCLGLAPISDRASFWAGRLLTVLFIYSFGLLFYAFLKLNGLRENAALLLAAAGIALPGFWYLSALLTGIHIVISYAFASVAAIALHLALTRDAWIPRWRLTAYAVGFISTVLAAFTYQAGLTALLSLFSLPLLLNVREPVGKQGRVLFAVLAVTASVSLIYLGWYLGSGNYGKLADDPYWGTPAVFADRLKWFFDTILPAAASLYFPHAPKSLVLSIAGAILVLLSFAYAQDIRKSKLDVREKLFAGSITLVVLVGIPIATLSPVLVSQSGLRYRTLIPLSIVLILFSYLAVSSYAEGLIDRLNRLSPLALFGLIAPLAFLSAFSITTMNVYQHAQELEFMRRTLEKAMGAALLKRRRTNKKQWLSGEVAGRY